MPSSRVLLLSWLPLAPSARCLMGLTVKITFFGLGAMAHNEIISQRRSEHRSSDNLSLTNSRASRFRQFETVLPSRMKHQAVPRVTITVSHLLKNSQAERREELAFSRNSSGVFLGPATHPDTVGLREKPALGKPQDGFPDGCRVVKRAERIHQNIETVVRENLSYIVRETAADEQEFLIVRNGTGAGSVLYRGLKFHIRSLSN